VLHLEVVFGKGAVFGEEAIEVDLFVIAEHVNEELFDAFGAFSVWFLGFEDLV
jgi:hypothetical protein